MALICPKPTEGNFEKCPTGTHQAVCQSVQDLGMIETKFNNETKTQHKIVIVWEINERIKTGKFIGDRYVMSKRYTFSLHEKSTLRKDLASWRGRDFTAEEMGNFDMEKLRGVNCLLSITAENKGEKTYTNVSAVMGLPKGTPTIDPELAADYKFEWIEKIKGTSASTTPEGIDTEIPF
jgi:hypothetical protein